MKNNKNIKREEALNFYERKLNFLNAKLALGSCFISLFAVLISFMSLGFTMPNFFKLNLGQKFMFISILISSICVFILIIFIAIGLKSLSEIEKESNKYEIFKEKK